ncbi:hypothetical protein K440DRAFT_660499 [Wilcoxina mikolae CBS 423.85]|nr:hypothetical protein K440DRAFT_660499 [Wilcoxina mikolae CBS 423.85]
MDLYSKPQESKYITGLTKWFQMPADGGKTIPAVAVSQNAGLLWSSGYAILITLLFTAAGKIVVDLVVTYFPLRGNGNRHAILVAFINTGDPISAMLLMANYVRKLLFNIRTKETPRVAPGAKSKEQIDWKTLLLTAFLWFVHAAIFTGSTAAGIIVPTNLIMGNMARVNPSAIFYPQLRVSGVNSAARQREGSNRLASVAASRAIGTVEYSKATLEEKVTFGKDALQLKNDQPVELSFDYSYNLTGLDFGLQRAPALLHTVKGHCRTEYDWLQGSNSTHDTYWLWGNKSLERVIPTFGNAIYLPPRASFETPTSNLKDLMEIGTARFSILPYTAGRRSRYNFNQSHPWYVTEKLSDPLVDTEYVIMAKRPAISCSQRTEWQYGTVTAKSTLDLKDLVQAGLKLAPFWIETVFPREFTLSPAIVTMSRNLGYYNLASAMEGFVSFNRIENSAADLVGDLKYLVLGSFVYSREVVRNTAMLSPNTEGLDNAAAVNGTVPDETADFVLESQDIATMSLRVLFSVPAIFLALWLWIVIRKKVLSSLAPVRNDQERARFLTRSTGLSAVQLYRYLDEEISGLRRWEGRLSSAPYILTVDEKEVKYDRRDPREAIEGRIPVSAQYPASDSNVDLKLTSVVVRETEATSADPHNHQALRPLASKYAIPRLMPLYKRSEHETGTSSAVPTRASTGVSVLDRAPAQAQAPRSTIVTTTEVPSTPATESPAPKYPDIDPAQTTYLNEKNGTESPPAKDDQPHAENYTVDGKYNLTRTVDKYELAMASSYRPKLTTTGTKYGWKPSVQDSSKVDDEPVASPKQPASGS